jgi:tetratricopeptide (TPR) repeat protein
MVNILIKQNKKTEAVNLVEQQLEKFPESPSLLLLYGTLLYNNGRFADSLIPLRKSQKIAPNTPLAYLMEGLALKQLGEFDEELAKRYRDYVRDKEIHSSSQMVLATLLEMAGDTEAAKDAYRRLLEVLPKFSAAANNLARLMANDGNPRNLDEAMILAQTAKELNPTNPTYADTLGWVHYKQRHYYVAALEFRQAIDKSPTTSLYHYHLALAYTGQDKKEEALHAVKQSLMLSESFPDRDKAEALYKKLAGENFK